MRNADSNPHGDARSDTPHADAAMAWLRSADAQPELLAEVRREMRRTRRRRSVSLALGATAAAAIAILALNARRTPPGVAAARTPPPAAVTATVLAPRQQTLPDGSAVQLKEGAEIAHEFSATRRDVRLLRGEAHFEVTSDPGRAFVVTAGAVAVRAVGTAFSIQFAPATVEVLVTHGRVAVESAAGEAPPRAGIEPAAMLEAGNRATIRLAESAAAPEVTTLTNDEVAQRLAWRVPQLEFSHTPLSEVVALMNRHGGSAPIRLELPPAEIAEMKLSGFLAADNVVGLLRLLEANFALESKPVDGAVVVRRKTVAPR